jgi:hypothetical protein
LVFPNVRCLAGWIDGGIWLYSTLSPFLYPALSSIAKIKNIARKAKFIVRKFGKFDKGMYVCRVRRTERLVQDESEFN